MYDTVLCQGYGTTGGIKQTGTHNTSEKCRGAWVVLRAHRPGTDISALPLGNCMEVAGQLQFIIYFYTPLPCVW